MILLSIMFPEPLKNPLDLQNSILIFILLILELLLTKPFFYWLVNTQLEIGTISEFDKLVTVDLNSSSIIYEVIEYFLIMGFFDLVITKYYTQGRFLNSPLFITLILLLEIFFVLSIYLL